VLAVVLFLFAPFVSAATRPKAEQDKIDFLIQEIRSSPGVFVRNGQEYDGKKAAAHVKGKLFIAGRRVQTAEDFIRGVASRSEESGKPYTLRSPGEPEVPLGGWLSRRLVAYERAHAGTKP